MVSISVNGYLVADSVLEARLNTIANTQTRGVYILRNDLSSRQNDGITRFFWAILGFFCPCLRASIYYSDLAVTRRILTNLSSDADVLSNPRLILAVQNARTNFDRLYPVRVQRNRVHVYSGIGAGHGASAVYVNNGLGSASVFSGGGGGGVHVAAGGGRSSAFVTSGRPSSVVNVGGTTTVAGHVLPGSGRNASIAGRVTTVNSTVTVNGHVLPGQRS